jgi:hypothetical protein
MRILTARWNVYWVLKRRGTHDEEGKLTGKGGIKSRKSGWRDVKQERFSPKKFFNADQSFIDGSFFQQFPFIFRIKSHVFSMLRDDMHTTLKE